MTSLSSLRVRLVGAVLLAVTPALVVMYFTRVPLAAFLGGSLVAALALAAAWFGGEYLLVRRARALQQTCLRLTEGDFSSRTGLSPANDEFGLLARALDQMAETVGTRVREREEAEQRLLNRALQQAVVSALSQFALTSKDFSALLEQAILLVSQTLEVEYCYILELQPDGNTLLLCAGAGWKDGRVGITTLTTAPDTEAGYTMASGEPAVLSDLANETRFQVSPLLREHGVVSGACVAIVPRDRTFGLLGAYSARTREFSGDDLQFLLAVANVLAMAVDRQRADADLLKLAAFAQLNPNPAMELAADGAITYFNDAALKLALTVGQEHPHGILPPEIADIVQTCLATGQSRLRMETRNNNRILTWSFHPVPASNVVHCYVEDSTDRLNLEAQFRQAQKMESVGQLAAGVAHDFNNMLTVIQGHAGMLLARPALPPELFESGQAIYFAAERAASLTRQLLLFSRKSIVQTQPLDLRELVDNLGKMLRRLLGETIQFVFKAPPQLPLIQGDPGMVEQVLMNLAVNARDAMPRGGRLAISTDAMDVNETYVQMHPESRAGSFVCLRVSDTGCGMDAATVARIFEPFFTTKDVGKGTGLGLATVYGIVKQHDGWIEVASEPGKGTTFSVFFPAGTQSAASAPAAPSPTTAVRGGHETILVVEDEPVLRDLASVILNQCGYRVLEAGSGVEALSLWEHHRGSVDLLLTDMVMPEGISGVELAQKLVASEPRLKVIFTSGYNVDDLDTALIATGTAAFLQKPYTRISLAQAVRERLDK